MEKKTRYLILGYSRSGTTVTHLAVKGHPNAAALNDELRPHPFFTKGISTFTHGNDSRQEKANGHSVLFDSLTLIEGTPDTSAHGAKIACNSYKLARAIVSVLQNHLKDVKVIIITRRDLVAQLGSGISARKSGIKHSWYKGFDNRTTPHFRIPKWRFTNYAISVFRMYEALSPLGQTHEVLEINYEDLLSDKKLFFEKIFRFLGLPILEPTWLKSQKVMPAPFEYIENYQSLAQRLSEVRDQKVPFHVLWISKVMGTLDRGFALVKADLKAKTGLFRN